MQRCGDLPVSYLKEMAKVSGVLPSDRPSTLYFALILAYSVTRPIEMSTMQVWGSQAIDKCEMLPLALDDVGFTSGVVIVDRLRTLGGRLRDLHEHIARFQQSSRAVGIQLPSNDVLHARAEACAEQERQQYAGQDFHLILVSTPGRIGDHSRQPTLLMYTQAIAWQRLVHWYRSGQTLVTSSHRNVPQACWSPKIKTRSRLHYYLADQEAISSSDDPYAAGLLLNEADFLTETSAANVLLIEGQRLVSPRRATILDGVSLGRTLRLAQECNISIGFEDISPQRAKLADAILLCGSSGCIWPAARLDDRSFAVDRPHAVAERLIEAWKRDVELDFVAQALAFESGSTLRRRS